MPHPTENCITLSAVKCNSLKILSAQPKSYSQSAQLQG